MKTHTFVVQVPRQRRRALELFSRDTPFRARTQRDQTTYTRKTKHRSRDWLDQ